MNLTWEFAVHQKSIGYLKKLQIILVTVEKILNGLNMETTTVA